MAARGVCALGALGARPNSLATACPHDCLQRACAWRHRRRLCLQRHGVAARPLAACACLAPPLPALPPLPPLPYRVLAWLPCSTLACSGAAAWSVSSAVACRHRAATVRSIGCAIACPHGCRATLVRCSSAACSFGYAIAWPHGSQRARAHPTTSACPDYCASVQLLAASMCVRCTTSAVL